MRSLSGAALLSAPPPPQSTVIAGMAQPDARGSYFGVSAIALAVDGSALYGASTTNGMTAMPWLIGGVGALSTAGLWLLNRRQNLDRVRMLMGVD